MSDIRWFPGTTSQIPMYVPWNGVDSTTYSSVCSLWYQYNPPLWCLGTDDVIPQEFVTVNHVRDLRFRQDHKVIVTLLDSTDCLWKAKAATIPYIICRHVESQGAGCLAPRRQWCWVKGVTAMPYWSSETYNHIFPLPWIYPICLESFEKMRRNLSRITYYRVCGFWPIKWV